MPPRDKPERGLETPRQARLTVMCIFGVLLFLVTVFGALVVDRWVPMGETRIVRPHFPAMIEIPMMAALAFLVAVLLPQTYGAIEFKILGVTFKGGTVPVVLWLLCFLGMVLAIRMLW